MSGPLDVADSVEVASVEDRPGSTLEIADGREARIGDLVVRRVLPRRLRRTVGAWCFADLMGPLAVTPEHGVEIGPHPHLGLHTVTWLVAGELLHRDSLDSEQVIRPGQLNLMTAGRGIAHAEEATPQYEGRMQGVQLWVAQPESTRLGAPAFEHHASLPHVEVGRTDATVLVGSFAGVASPARADTPLVGVDAVLRTGVSTWPLRRGFEHALVVLDGVVQVDDSGIRPGQLGYLGAGRDELVLSTTEGARVLLLGGEPFESAILMWWNFVARSREEMDTAAREWNAEGELFGRVDSRLPRVPAPTPVWPRQ